MYADTNFTCRGVRRRGGRATEVPNEILTGMLDQQRQPGKLENKRHGASPNNPKTLCQLQTVCDIILVTVRGYTSCGVVDSRMNRSSSTAGGSVCSAKVECAIVCRGREDIFHETVER